MRLGYFTMPMHPLDTDYTTTLKQYREAIILCDKLGFYDAIDGEQSGLDIYHVEILPTGSSQVFQFILTLTQNIRRASIIDGHARMDVEGTQDDRPVTLYWSRLNDGNVPEPAFRFKYFQQLEGYLTLPEGFQPTRLRITLDAGQRRNPVQQSYNWEELLNGGTLPQ